MAGIAARLVQNLGATQGNLNPGIYQMSVSAPTAFHDVTLASSGVTSCDLNIPSMCNNSIPGPAGLSGGQPGFAVGTGYDEVTGLGSLDAAAAGHSAGGVAFWAHVAGFAAGLVGVFVFRRPERQRVEWWNDVR